MLHTRRYVRLAHSRDRSRRPRSRPGRPRCARPHARLGALHRHPAHRLHDQDMARPEPASMQAGWPARAVARLRAIRKRFRHRIARRDDRARMPRTRHLAGRCGEGKDGPQDHGTHQPHAAVGQRPAGAAGNRGVRRQRRHAGHRQRRGAGRHIIASCAPHRRRSPVHTTTQASARHACPGSFAAAAKFRPRRHRSPCGAACRLRLPSLCLT